MGVWYSAVTHSSAKKTRKPKRSATETSVRQNVPWAEGLGASRVYRVCRVKGFKGFLFRVQGLGLRIDPESEAVPQSYPLTVEERTCTHPKPTGRSKGSDW